MRNPGYWAPIEGVRLWLNDEDTEYAYDGTIWVVYPMVGRLSKSVAGGSDVTLTAAEARNQILEFTGTLTASSNVIVPAAAWEWIVYNGTAGVFTLTVKAASGTGVVVTQGKRAFLYADGTNVVGALTDPVQLPTGAAQSIGYAASITPDAVLGERVIIGTLAGNLTLNAPTNPRTGAMLVFSFTQDAAGGRTITWNAGFKKAADGAGAANQKGAISFIYDGASWVQVGGALAWAHEGVGRYAYDDATGKAVRPWTTFGGR